MGFEDALFTSLPETPRHTYTFSRFVNPTIEKRGKSTSIDIDLVSFDHDELEHGKELSKYATFTVFHANLNLTESNMGHMYLLGALQNIAMLHTVYPGWKPLLYIDSSSYHAYQSVYQYYIHKMLEIRPDSLLIMVEWHTEVPHAAVLSSKYDMKIPFRADLADLVRRHRVKSGKKGSISLQFMKTMWRFFPASRRCISISRDTDSRVNTREALAVKEWIESSYPMHRIFDSRFYGNPFLAGLWGTKPSCPHVVASWGAVESECSSKCAAVPKVTSMFADFFTAANMKKGYGIDELFLVAEERLSKAQLYSNVMTHGYGSFFTLTDGMSLVKDFQSDKIGRKMYSLMGCKGPAFEGYKNHMEKVESGTYVSEDTSFVGENLVMENNIPPSLVNMIVDMTVEYGTNGGVFDSDMIDWVGRLKQYRVAFRHESGAKFLKHLTTKSISDFTDTYGFDKRFFPSFWYCFDRVLMHDTFSFSRIDTACPDEYEVRLWEDAYRAGVARYPKEARALSGHVSNTEYESKYYPKLLNMFLDDKFKKLSVGKKRVNVSEFFQHVWHSIKSRSRVYNHLTEELQDGYVDGCLMYYPFSSIRSMNLEF